MSHDERLIPAPHISPCPPPLMTDAVLAVLRGLADRPGGWMAPAEIGRTALVTDDRVRAIARQMVGCGWAERRKRLTGVLVYRLTEAGLREAVTTGRPDDG